VEVAVVENARRAVEGRACVGRDRHSPESE